MLAAKTKKTMTLDNQSIWILMILVMALSWLIQARLKSRFAKYSEVPLGLSGAEVASRMLQAHGIHDVKIVSIPGKLTDHYDPTTKTVNLSEDVYYGRSVAAAAVAAHECGHVVQHATGYAWLQMRSALVPVVSFSSNIVSWVLLAGVLLINSFPSLIWIGIGLFALTTLFSFITLPVEINASLPWTISSHRPCGASSPSPRLRPCPVLPGWCAAGCSGSIPSAAGRCRS